MSPFINALGRDAQRDGARVLTKPLDLAPYARALVLDTQVILEGKPLLDLPWADLSPDGPILLLCMPKMLSEVDSWKRDGRVGGRARRFNRLIEPCVSSSGPITLISGPPRVDIALPATGRINWEAVPDLDPNEGDDRIVAEALHSHVSDTQRLTIFSYDIRPRAAAGRHGLAALTPPDAWILDPEPAPNEKENMRLRQRVRELEETHPKLSLQLQVESVAPFVLVRVRPLTHGEAESIEALWLERHPEQSRHRWEITTDFSYSGRYEKFEKRVRKYGSRLPLLLERLFNQVAFQISLSNEGAVPAEHIDLQLIASGALLHDKFVLGRVMLPEPPVYNAGGPLVHFPNTLADLMPTRHVRHEVVFDPPSNRESKVRLACEDFRQGRTYHRRIYATLDAHSASPSRMEAVLTAGNLNGQITASLELPFDVREVTYENLIDVMSSKLVSEFPLQDLVRDLISSGKREELHFPGD
jgi:hypothetical protein